MVERASGSIINIASVGGIVGLTDRLAYTATKFAVVGLTKSMALDHATDGVRVNCICPGRVETPFVKARISEYPDPDAAYREMSLSQPVGRMARPEEIAGKIRTLLGAQLTSAVLWDSTVKNMIDDGIRRFIEVGPGKVLTGMIRGIDSHQNGLISL